MGWRRRMLQRQGLRSWEVGEGWIRGIIRRFRRGECRGGCRGVLWLLRHNVIQEIPTGSGTFPTTYTPTFSGLPTAPRPRIPQDLPRIPPISMSTSSIVQITIVGIKAITGISEVVVGGNREGAMPISFT